MSDQMRTSTVVDREEEELRQLFAAAGARPEVPAADSIAIRATARAALDEVLLAGAPRAEVRMRRASLLLAASLLVALAVGWWIWRPGAGGSGAPMATVALVRGEARWTDGAGRGATGGAATLAPGDELDAGSAVETAAGDAAGTVAFRLASGGSLRLAPGSKLRWLGPVAVALDAGALYVDSGPTAGGARALEVHTPSGRVVELGTQFETRVEAGGGLRLRVREGAVELERQEASHRAVAGEELLLAADGRLRRGRVSTHGAEWDWVLASAPAFDIEGRSLGEFLDWACRETGWELRFASPALAAEAATIRLHGALAGARPDEAVQLVLAGAGFGSRREDGTLVVTGLPPAVSGPQKDRAP